MDSSQHLSSTLETKLAVPNSKFQGGNLDEERCVKHPCKPLSFGLFVRLGLLSGALASSFNEGVFVAAGQAEWVRQLVKRKNRPTLLLS